MKRTLVPCILVALLLCQGCGVVPQVREAYARYFRAECWVEAEREAPWRARKWPVDSFPIPSRTAYEKDELLNLEFARGYRMGVSETVGSLPWRALSDVTNGLAPDLVALSDGKQQGRDEVVRRYDNFRFQLYHDLLREKGITLGMPTSGEVLGLRTTCFLLIVLPLLIFFLIVCVIIGIIIVLAKGRHRQNTRKTNSRSG